MLEYLLCYQKPNPFCNSFLILPVIFFWRHKSYYTLTFWFVLIYLITNRYERLLLCKQQKAVCFFHRVGWGTKTRSYYFWVDSLASSSLSVDLASSCVVKLLCFFTFQAELFVAERHCFLRHSLWFLVLLFFFLHNWKVMQILTVKNVNSGIYSLVIRSCCQNDMMLSYASRLVEVLMIQEGFVDRQRFLFL